MVIEYPPEWAILAAARSMPASSGLHAVAKVLARQFAPVCVTRNRLLRLRSRANGQSSAIPWGEARSNEGGSQQRAAADCYPPTNGSAAQ